MLTVAQNHVEYTASGTASEVFTIPFYYLERAHIRVWWEDPDDGAITEKTQDTHFTVSEAGHQTGGTVTWIGTPDADAIVHVVRWVDPLQETDYVHSGTLSTTSLEQSLDRFMMIAQQILDAHGAFTDEDGQIAFSPAYGEFMHLTSSSADVWEGNNHRIANVDDPVDAQDAATKAWVTGLVFTSSDIIAAPEIGEVGYVLSATSPGPGTVGWGDRGFVAPDRADQVMRSTGATLSLRQWSDPNLGNLVINGGMTVWQMGIEFTGASTPANSDDTYTADQWILLSDGNDIVDVSRVATVPTGAFRALNALVATQNKKFGFLQIIEARDAARVIGGAASLSFKARTSSSARINNLRAAILSWSSTADTVTSDVVSAWGASGTNPTLVANWTYENTPENLAVTQDAWGEHKIEGVLIDTASAANVAVFIWSDDGTTDLNDVVIITDVRLVPGYQAQPGNARSFEEDVTACQRFLQKSFPLATAPAAAAGVNGSEATLGGSGTARCIFGVRFSQTMRGVPAITTYNPVNAGAGIHNLIDASDHACTAGAIGDAGFRIDADTPAAGLTNDTCIVHWIADARL